MKRVLVTGSQGFIGRNLCRRLETIGIDLVTNANNGNHDLDVNNLEEMLSIKHKVDAVIHLAAKTCINNSFKNPRETYYTNLLGTLNTLEFARKRKVRRFIYNSTYVYGQPKYLPVDESHPVNPHSPYNLSKFLAEELCKNYSKDFGLNVVTLRPFYVYGPYCNRTKIIPTIIHQTKKRNGIIKLTGRNIRRDFLFIKDFVDLVIKILNNFPQGYNTYNVGSGASNTLEEVAEIIGKLLGRKITIDYDDEKGTGDVVDMIADNSKICKEFNWLPTTSLHDGLGLTLKHDPREPI